MQRIQGLLKEENLSLPIESGHEVFKALTDPHESGFRGVGARKVWACTVRMSHFLDVYATERSRRGTNATGVAVEIGAGTAALSMLLTRRNWRVAATDLPWLLPLTHLNTECNDLGPGNLSVLALRWGQPADVNAIRESLLPARGGESIVDLAFGSDVCYFEDDFDPLLDSLQRLGARENILAIQSRNGCVERFSEAATRRGWQVVPAVATSFKYDSDNGLPVCYARDGDRASVLRLIAPDDPFQTALPEAYSSSTSHLPLLRLKDGTWTFIPPG